MNDYDAHRIALALESVASAINGMAFVVFVFAALYAFLWIKSREK